jgi:hypothetical protein
VWGYDSIIYYTGSSKQIQDVNKGKVSDSAFMNVMFQKIRKGSLAMTLKPGDGADVVPRSYFIYCQDGKGFHSPS